MTRLNADARTKADTAEEHSLLPDILARTAGLVSIPFVTSLHRKPTSPAAHRGGILP
jgi:hypothetical protein